MERRDRFPPFLNSCGRPFAALALVLLFASCAPPPPPEPRLTLEPAKFGALAGWETDNQAEALAAFLLSCPALAESGARAKSPAEGANFGSASDWQAACEDAGTVPAGDDAAARAFFERRFTPYLAGDNGEAEGLFTGYYVPELKGSKTAHGPYRVPLHRVPDDLVTADLGQFSEDLAGKRIVGRVEKNRFIPYPARSEIDAGALEGRALEIVYVDDPVDAFFLHIQGSGRVVLDDGHVLNVGYAGGNGRPYVAIGRELIARGAMAKEDVTMQSIRAWLEAHPGQAEEIMEANPSYVFFREIDGPFPIGGAGIALTPERSLAVDRRFVPYGVPLWLATDAGPNGTKPLARLMIAQDTGGAIAGPVRGDVFWGFGAAAGGIAGRMKDQGRYYLLLPKTAAVANN
jgi:peptidoglycan lytic transglycosylase A